MALWNVVAHEDFPIWIVARKLIHRERLNDGFVRWLLEASDSVLYYPRSPKGIRSVEAADSSQVPAA